MESSTARPLHALVPGAVYADIRGGRHGMMWTHPDEVNDVLTRFLILTRQGDVREPTGYRREDSCCERLSGVSRRMPESERSDADVRLSDDEDSSPPRGTGTTWPLSRQREALDGVRRGPAISSCR